eukprot:3575947-Rhodomonas_salina.1
MKVGTLSFLRRGNASQHSASQSRIIRARAGDGERSRAWQGGVQCGRTGLGDGVRGDVVGSGELGGVPGGGGGIGERSGGGDGGVGD